MKLGPKIVLSKLVLVTFAVGTLAAVSIWQAQLGFARAVAQSRTGFEANSKLGEQALVGAGVADLQHQAQAVHAMCTAQQELLEQNLQADLRIARRILEELGPLTLGDTNVNWSVADPQNGATRAVELPALVLGGQALEASADANHPAPVVDQVRELTGVACTLFQRMGPAGDMLRVCTTVRKKDGGRAVGTCITAQTSDGKPDPRDPERAREQTVHRPGLRCRSLV